MPLGLGIALSHSPTIYRPRSTWNDIYRQLVGDTPQPNRAAIETEEVLDEYAERIESAIGTLKAEIRDYKPDMILVVVSDRKRMFDETQVPQIHVYIGNDIWGSTVYTDLGEEGSISDVVNIPCHAALAGFLAEELTWAGYDLNISRMKFTPLGDPDGGVGHNLTDPILRLVPALDIPIVPIHINAHVNPAISGHRMAPFGRSIAAVLKNLPERVAILASGGLSGDPFGYLAGWIDETLDHWVLTRLARGRADQLKTIWDLDSDTVRGSTREVRNWIVVGGAMEEVGAKAEITDYVRFHHAAVGTAFASWNPGTKPLDAPISDLGVVPGYSGEERIWRKGFYYDRENEK